MVLGLHCSGTNPCGANGLHCAVNQVLVVNPCGADGLHCSRPGTGG